MSVLILLLCTCFHALLIKGAFLVDKQIPFYLVQPPRNVLTVDDQTCNVRLTEMSPGINDASNPQFTYTKLTTTGTMAVFYVVRLRQPCSDYYITRDATITNLNGINLAQAESSILWEPRECDIGGSTSFTVARFTFTYQLPGSRVKFLMVSNDQLQIGESQSASCDLSRLNAFIFPNGPIKRDLCINDVMKAIASSATYNRGKRQATAARGRLLRLTVQNGDNKYLVTRKRNSDGTYADGLSVSNFCRECLSKDSLFYYEGYNIASIESSTGRQISEEGFTLLHVMSMQFLTTDVSASMNLNLLNESTTGLKFQNAEGYNDDDLLDYRHFVVQRREDNNRTFVVHVCPLHHRRFCLFPTNGGSVRLHQLHGSQVNLQPTFQTPPDPSFSKFNKMVAERQRCSRIPTFGVFERSPVTIVGAPEVVFISMYIGHAGVVDGNKNSPLGSQNSVLSYDYTKNQLIFRNWAEAIQSPYRIVRRRWSEPGSPSVYISLQVVDKSSALGTNHHGLYITRSSVVPVALDSAFGTLDTDDRLFNEKCCFCSQDVADVYWIYFNSRDSHVISLSASPNMTLTLNESVRPSTSLCQEYALRIST